MSMPEKSVSDLNGNNEEPTGAQASAQAITATSLNKANENYYTRIMNLPAPELEKWKLQQKLTALQKENDYLGSKKHCTLCGYRERNITFLPCAHFTTCNTCSEPIYECPTCKRDILATAETFLS